MMRARRPDDVSIAGAARIVRGVVLRLAVSSGIPRTFSVSRDRYRHLVTGDLAFDMQTPVDPQRAGCHPTIERTAI
jgi:hypothetical protein